jgi:hypothetical protein
LISKTNTAKIKTWVCAAGNWVDIDTVNVIDVEEGIYGDVITFIYKGKKYQSRAVSGSRPG